MPSGDLAPFLLPARQSYYGADLREADLRCAALPEAVLERAILVGANFSGADLRAANLRYADLRWAKLRYAKLQGADLTGADVIGTDFACAHLRGATLPNEYVATCRAETLRMLRQFKDEVACLCRALLEGRIDGTRSDGGRADPLATLVHSRQELEGDSCHSHDYDTGIETTVQQWLFQIRLGDTPNQPVRSSVHRMV
jgi:Pentapeptide repeats (8 copies)